MVTVEAAVSVTALVAVLALLLGAIGVVRTQAELCQSVREGARAESLGQEGSAAVSARFSGAVDVQVGGDQTWVRVEGQTSAATIGSLSVGSLHCAAETLREPGVLSGPLG